MACRSTHNESTAGADASVELHAYNYDMKLLDTSMYVAYVQFNSKFWLRVPDVSNLHNLHKNCMLHACS